LRPWLGLVAAAALAAALAWPLAAPAGHRAAQEAGVEVVSVHDGDTLTVRLHGRKERVRLLGVDAPEMGDSPKLQRAAARAGRAPRQEAALGALARDFVRDLVGPGDRVRLGFEPGGQRRDEHKRLLAWLWLADGRQVNELLLSEGYARVYRRCQCRALPRLRGLEAQARGQGRGLWGRGGP
ncbi:MAG: thermonuclease family protein, partial [Pseudomonadota bacterium]